MLRTNLSTRPFYNIRAVQVTLGAMALLVIVLTLLNLVQLIRLTSSGRALGARAAQAEADAQRLRDEARRIRSQIDAKELNDVAAAAEEANAIIDLRAFSWSELFAQLETTEPANVRLTSFQTVEDRTGRLIVNLRVEARQVQDLESFIDALEKTGVPTRVQTAIEIRQVAEPYIRRRAIRHLERGHVVIFAAGTGNPYFSTDTAAALRAMEIHADALFKATKVEGVYDKDPVRFPEARMVPTMSFDRFLADRIGVMDSTAVTLCRDNKLKIRVFKLTTRGNIKRVVFGENIGTIVGD